MFIAITREVPGSIVDCELTHLARTPIDVVRARAQHEQYCDVLRVLGLEVLSLPEEPDLPDSVFVEDAAVVLDEVAVLTRPGANSRRPEVESIAQALEPFRPLLRIESPATLDGGDVLVVGRKIFVGQTLRTNASALEQMTNLLKPFGYEVIGVPVTECLHLKSGVTQVAENTLLINPAWVEKKYFPGFDFIETDPSEPFAANALLVGKTVIYPSAFAGTRARLETVTPCIVTVEADELSKAEGGVTCCSLVFKR
ncbi:MAG: dimethylargininase [Anaerolineaceae bacterium]|nr:MAG: dimethylargininase [Anaerolineaceae bacterium]